MNWAFLTKPSITDWIIAVSTVIGACAAIAAAIYTKRSASEAANAAMAAAEQVELQRPGGVRGVDPRPEAAARSVRPLVKLSSALIPLLLHLGMKPSGITSHGLPDCFGPRVRMHVVQAVTDSV